MIYLSLAILFITMLSGVPTGFAFLAACSVFLIDGVYTPDFMLPYGVSKVSAVVIFAVPLFIMAGSLIERGNIGDKLTDLISSLVGRIRGGMGVVTILSCAVFGSITGSAAATLSCIGSIMFPKLAQNGFSKAYSASLMANASVLGLLIPPSGIMIIYSWVGGQSVLACFLATIIPGIILTILLSVINIFLLRNDKNIKVISKEEAVKARKDFVPNFFRAIPALLLPVLVLGGIYSGAFTPTEAAAVSILYAIPVGFFIYKGLTLKGLFEGFAESAMTTGAIIIMMLSVAIISRFFTMEDLPGQLLRLMQAVSSDKLVMLLMINCFLVVMGMVMDDISAILLCTPILIPIAIKIGVSPVQLAAIMGVNLGMGNITPPCAPLLYISSSINDAPINKMMRPAMAMITFGWIPTLILTTYFPSVSLWLPRLILGIN
ncbi:TRAP transporter large permease [Desulfobacula sp.]|uniref:TRAP transporter large permease n=1 Tax=Desulfobacula sp. TaxID=2593537 RepID=UPI002625CDBD|nr:TRAP transporter large permease [Desulfobacula sp.]